MGFEQTVAADCRLGPPTCTGSALPMTMACAAAWRSRILPHLRSAPRAWPFEDRVLAWLLPSLRGDVEQFHRRSGPTMCQLFRDFQLDTIDRSCRIQLGVWIERLSPGSIAAVRQVATTAHGRTDSSEDE